MEKHPPLPMTPFDMITTSDNLQMMKLLLPYIPPAMQGMLAFYIKFMELQNAIRYFGLFHSKTIHSKDPDLFSRTSPSPSDMLEDLRPYLGKEAETIDMVLSAMTMMETMKDMDMPFSPEGVSPGSSMPDMAEMMNMVQMFQNMSGNENSENRNNENDTKKGNDAYGTRMDEPSGNEEH